MLLLLLALQAPDPAPAAAPVYRGSDRQLDVAIPRIDTAATVDGRLDEPVWQRAALLTGFSQYRPVDSRPAADSTEVLVWYAPDAIWFGIRAFESHGQVVRATLADRDNIGADDYVQILLDTYDDHRRALIFAVNPLGMQQDGVRTEGQDAGAAGGAGVTNGRFDGIVDINPDYTYESKGHVTPWGYEVEVRIPFKSLRYQSADPQRWGIQIVRTTQHSGYEDTWTPVVRASASFLIQSGRFTGLTGLHRGLVMDLNPEFTTKVDGTPRTPPADYLYIATPEVGGNVRWGITQNLGLNATVNPDFSQVEADVGQVTVNERFALFFPEKRPFFLEGLEQYDTQNRLIYTRRIVSPLGGAKLIGKVGGTNVAYLAAVDDRSQSTSGEHPLYNLLRVRRDLGASSSAGLVYTDRVDGSAYNRVLGGDARLIWHKIWFSAVQLVGSWTLDNQGPRFAPLWDVTLYDRTGRSYGNHAELIGIHPGFVAASGFVPRANIVAGRWFNRFTWYGKPGGLIEQIQTFTGASPIWRYDDFTKLRGIFEGGWSSTWSATFRGGWGLSAAVSDNMQRWDSATYAGYRVDRTVDTAAFALPSGIYNLWGGTAGVTSPNRALTFGANASYGSAPIFAEAARGRVVALQGEAQWRPTPAVRIDAMWVHQRLTRARDGSRFSTANIPRVKIEYQLTRDIFVRYVGQYVAQNRTALVDPRTGQPLVLDSATVQRLGPAASSSSNDFRNDLLFSYRPTPGTVLFLGYGTSLTEPDAFRFQSLSRTGDGFFLKASYLFRM
jgi:hypothetical protein